jgi:hypothetical protein
MKDYVVKSMVNTLTGLAKIQAPWQKFRHQVEPQVFCGGANCVTLLL